MSKLTSLKAATSLSDVAKLVSYRPSAVSYILYQQPAASNYTTFQIPKRNGGCRTIKAPVKALKVLQRKLSDLLQDCVEEINTDKKRKDRMAHGFKRKRSIITNARQHRRRRWVFNLDLEDFFPSINFGRVRGFLLKNRDFELHQDVATVIAQIACHENSLPQGSPWSVRILAVEAFETPLHGRRGPGRHPDARPLGPDSATTPDLDRAARRRLARRHLQSAGRAERRAHHPPLRRPGLHA